MVNYKVEESYYKDGFIIVPLKIKSWLQEQNIKKIYLTRGLGGCLFLFTEDQWKGHTTRLTSIQGIKEFVGLLSRDKPLEFKRSKYDKIPLLKVLKDYSRIEEEIVFIYKSKRIEIWDKKQHGGNKQ